MTRVVEISEPAERSRIAEAVLRDLPEWFGIEESTRQYIEAAATLPTLVVEPDAGFLCLKQHTPQAVEIYVMGVRREQHRKGIGRALIAAAESWCRVRGIPYLHVKTLGPSRPDPGRYDATRAFYEAVGFVALEELHGLWDENNPTLVLVKDVRPGFTVTPVEGLPELREGDDLAALIAERTELADGDVVVVAQKAVSKAEGRVLVLDGVEPSARARELAGPGTDLRLLEVILSETVRVVRARHGLVIAETRHGFVCASAGVDHSNAPKPGTVVLLPLDPDASARRIRATLAERAGVDVAVIVTDSFGRPFRQGTTDVAIGVAGLAPLRDLRGTPDRAGRPLRSTQVAVADELAAAANLVRTTKADGIPVVIVRGAERAGDGAASELVIPPDRDLFR